MAEQEPTDSNASPSPIKSILRKRTRDESESPDKPAVKRSISFVPGLITGKSDVAEISPENESTRSNEHTPQNTTSLDSTTSTSPDDTLVLSAASDPSLSTWRWGGNGTSGSETSDTEQDFAKLNDKYRSWSKQHERAEERKAAMALKHSQTVRKLRQTRSNIARLKHEISNDADDVDSEAARAHQRFKKRQKRRGVVYIASVPFGCTSEQLRKIFSELGRVSNVHMESANGEDGKEKRIHGKWSNFVEAWVEFSDRKVAKQVAELLHETKVPRKYIKNRHAVGHVWNIRYLKGFGWHHLREYKQTVRVLQRKKMEMKVADAQRQASYFEAQVRKAKQIAEGQREWEDEWQESSDEEMGLGMGIGEPASKKQKVVVQQRKVRKRGNHYNAKLLKKLRQ